MAARPPKPPLLACPASVAGLEADDARTFYVSIRDGKSFFDQLRLPPSLSRAMCRPAVSVGELLSCTEGDENQMTKDELTKCLVDGGDVDNADMVYPAALVFPMGFSWSSCVAQSTMLRTLTVGWHF